MTDECCDCGTAGCDPCVCGHTWADHNGNYNGSEACDHCPCPRFNPLHRVRVFMPGDS